MLVRETRQDWCPGAGLLVQADVQERRRRRGRGASHVSLASGTHTRCVACGRRLLAKVQQACSPMCGCGLVHFVVPAHKPKGRRTFGDLRARVERELARRKANERSVT